MTIISISDIIFDMKPTTPQWIERQPDSKPDTAEYEQKKKTWMIIGVTALTAAAIFGGVGVAVEAYSNDVMAKMPKITANTIDPYIQSIEIGPNSHLRSGHEVQNGNEPNMYRSLDETITITAKNMVTNSEGDNGEWVKLPYDAIKEQDKDFELKTNSGIPVDPKSAEIWVNHLGAPITRTETTSTTKP